MDIQEVARNTFTISALLLTATIVILNYSWKRLRTLIRTMPKDKQRVTFNMRSISDPNEADKYTYIAAQLLSCLFLAASLAGALLALLQMSGVMVGDTGGPYAADNFEFSVVAMRIAVFCLFLGIFSSSIGYFEDLVALCTGKPSVATTKLEKLPKRSSGDKGWSNFLAGLLCVFLIILLMIELFIPFNQWVKMTIGFAVGIVLIASSRFVYRLYILIQKKYVSIRKDPNDANPK